jgi:FkbM family methyltransferase
MIDFEKMQWKRNEHKNLKNYGYEHNVLKDLLSKDYKKKKYNEWFEYPKLVAESEGFKFSDDTPGGSLKEVYVDKIYDVKGFIPEYGDVVVDVGASFGDTSLYWGKKNAHVYAFEPLTAVFDILAKNVKLNNLENVIQCFNYALGTGEELSFSRIGNMMTFLNPNLKIKTYKLDDLNIKPDIIKIDVEGFEMDVLNGSKNTLLYKPKLIIEVHSKNLKEQVINFLKYYGYEIKFSGKIRKNKNMDLIQNLFLV